MSILGALLSRLSRRSRSLPPEQAFAQKIASRQKLVSKFVHYVPLLRTLLLIAGYLFFLALPLPHLSRKTYVSENAIQAAQVSTYWNWPEVNIADKFADNVKAWTVLPSAERALAIQQIFANEGLSSAVQTFQYGQNQTGHNVWAILKATKSDGAEALVLSASWLSRDKVHTWNERGVATVLAMTRFFRRNSYWSKDIILLISDGYFEGTQAWLAAYHADSLSLARDNLALTTGPIWAAINIDYPYHSFSHAGIYYDGANGQLPNLDLVNSVAYIARWEGGVPIILHDSKDESETSWLPSVLQTSQLSSYFRVLKNLLKQNSYAATNVPSGPEGLYGRYQIDAITILAVPAEGPHGFHAIGKTIESSFRSLNNLLERLHQSYFLYLLGGTDRFISISNYLIAPMLISAAITIIGLEAAVQCSNQADLWSEGIRSLTLAIIYSVLCWFIGLITYQIYHMGYLKSSIWSIPFAFQMTCIAANRSSQSLKKTSTTQWLRCCHLLTAGLVTAVTACLNFALGSLLAMYFGILPLILSLRTRRKQTSKKALSMVTAMDCAAIAWILMKLPTLEVNGLEEVTWTVPIVLIVIVPLAMQRTLAASL